MIFIQTTGSKDFLAKEVGNRRFCVVHDVEQHKTESAIIQYDSPRRTIPLLLTSMLARAGVPRKGGAT